MVNLSLDRRLALARDTRSRGYNCAQSVIAAFPDIIPLPPDTALKLGTALGAGMGGSGQVCGVLSAIAIAEGMRSGDPADKATAYRHINDLVSRFSHEHGATACPELKKLATPCNRLIESAVGMYHEFLSAKAADEA